MIRVVIASVCLVGGMVRHSCAQTPRVELDHVYMVVQAGGEKEIAALRSAGLTIGKPQQHEGEGTTSVAAMFENGYIELMWLDSAVAVTPEHAAAVEQFRQAAAWRVSKRSPFGFGLRRLPGDTARFPFPIAREPAPWIDSTAAYEILNQPADSLAVDVFVVPNAAAVPNWIERTRKRAPHLLVHPGGGKSIARVRLYGSVEQQPTTFALVRPARIETLSAREPLLEIYIDGGAKTSRTDLRPTLPIVIVR